MSYVESYVPAYITDPEPQGAADPFSGVFAPGAPELGIKQIKETSGDTPWGILEQQGLFQPPYGNAQQLLNQNLAATPYLDRQAFGVRPANPVDAVNMVEVGQTVTVLNPTRLSYLEQERAQLSAVEKEKDPAKKSALLRQLTDTIGEELNYAATEQAVPNPDQLAQPISARARDDKTFQGAVNSAVTNFKAELEAQGRTPSQIGVIDKLAAAGNFNAVRATTKQQLLALVGKDQGSAALGDMTGRGSIYMTYDGGDPRFARAVEEGIQDAQQEALVTRPVNAVAAAYRTGGPSAAMQTLSRMTNPQTVTPGQVGQIMADSRVQSIIKQSVDKLSGYNQYGEPTGTIQDWTIIQGLAAACQNATYSDLGKPGLGKQAVDQVAGYIVDQAKDDQWDNGRGMFQFPGQTAQAFANAGQQGNVSLGLAVAAKAQQANMPTFAGAALYGVRSGLDSLAQSSRALNAQAVKQAAFLSVPVKEWGGNSTVAQQAALVQKLIADNPADAKALNATGLQMQQMQETISSASMAVQEYSGSLKGVVGFDTPGPQNPGAEQWYLGVNIPQSSTVTAALSSVPKPAAADAPPSNSDPTNSIWFQRSLRKVIDIVGKGYINSLGLDGGTAKTLQNVWKRANKTLGAVLYFQNAAYELGEFGKDTADGALVNGLADGASGIRQTLAGVSYGLSAGIPSNSLNSIRPGSGSTAMANTFEDLTESVDGLDVADGVKAGLKTGLRFALEDTSDFASAVLGAVDAILDFSQGKPWEGVGNVLNTAGYAAFLTGTGIDDADIAAGETVAGLGATAWTGIGAAVVLLGSAIYTGANAYSNSHQFDGADAQWLEGMGVKPDVAIELAKHATTLGSSAPTAGPFLTQYFKYNHMPQDDMVSWFNTLNPQQANSVANMLKVVSSNGGWTNASMTEKVQLFDTALLQIGLMPPDAQLVSNS